MEKNPPGSFYRHILKDAWTITRTNKRLWLFGFFASFLGVGGVYELVVQGTGKLGLSQDFGSYLVLSALVPTGPEIAAVASELGAYNAVFLAVVGLAALGLFAVAVWVVLSSQGGLLLGIRDADKGRRARFSELFGAGSEVSHRLLAVNAVARFAIAASFYLILSLMLLLLAKATLLASLLYLAAFLVLMPFTLIVGFITIYAAAYVVIDRMHVLAAIETAVALFRKYWLISLETALILFAVNIAVSLGIGVAFSLIAFVLLPVVVGVGLSGADLGLWVVLGLALLAGLAVLVVVGAVLQTFQYATWTLLFMRLHTHGKTAVAKIVRLLGRFFHR